jgi:hypothetical protein
MKKILTLVFILFLLKAGAQTSVTAVNCSSGKYYVRVTFTDEFIPLHNVSTTTCSDGSVHYDTEESQFLKCYMELFADAACTTPVPVDPRFFEYSNYITASHGTREQPSFLYIPDCSITIPPGLEYKDNWRTDHYLIYTLQCIWQCSGGGYYDCYTTGPGYPTNFNIIINCCFGPTVLVVHLLDFDGQRNAGINTLSWKLENKVDFTKLLVERSFDGVQYDAVYSTTDVNVSTYADAVGTTAYYRLRVYNTNGTFFISPAVVLKAAPVVRELKVSPSPFKDVLQVAVSSPVKSLSVFKLCSIEGKTVFVAKRELKAGVNNLIINIPPVCKGVYILTMSNSEGTVSKKVVKQ